MHIPRNQFEVVNPCSVLRPDWNGMPVSQLQESWIILSHPISVVLLAATAVVIWQGYSLLGLAVALAWVCWLGHHISIEMLHDPYFLAIEQGCIGHVTPFRWIALISSGTLVFQWIMSLRIFNKRADP